MLKSCFAKKLTCHMPPACKNCLHPPTPQGPHQRALPHLFPLAALERLGRVLFSSTPIEHPLYTCVCEPRPRGRWEGCWRGRCTATTTAATLPDHTAGSWECKTSTPRQTHSDIRARRSQGCLNLTLMTGTDDSIFSKIKKRL